MQSADDLARRVAELEKEVAVLRAGRYPVVRRRTSWGIGDLPFFALAVGPDPSRGELRGHAKAVVAVGDIATGVLAIGGWARGLVALGGLATGVVSLGGLSIGVLLAAGGLAIGGLAIGGGAVGAVAIGGAAAGHYACGGGAAGNHVVSAMRRDPAAVDFFARHGLEPVCGGQGRWRERPRGTKPPTGGVE
jgi:hypothetical protein